MGSTPVVTQLQAIPVAGRDSMLLNLSGAHGPFFTRNLLILTDSAGRTGVGEVPGGEKIRQTLEDARELVVGQPVANVQAVLQQMQRRFADRDAGGRGLQTFDLRTTIHAVTAVESAMLDLLGQHLGVPVAALLGEGQQRDAVEMLGYLFYVGDRAQDRSALCRGARRARRLVAPAPRAGDDAAAIVRLAEAARERYGFNDFKLKGGVLRGDEEVEAIVALHERFPRARVTLDPNGGWLLQDAIRLMRDMRGVVAYAEDPCGAEQGFSGPRGDGGVPPRHRPAHRHQHGRHRLAAAGARARAAVGRHSAGRPAFLDHGRLGARGADLPRLGPDLGLALEQPLRRLAGDVHARRCRRARQGDGDRHALDLAGRPAADEETRCRSSAATCRCPKQPGLGVELDMAEVEKAHQLYKQHGLGARDDAMAMQYLVPNWTFDPKRPCLVR